MFTVFFFIFINWLSVSFHDAAQKLKQDFWQKKYTDPMHLIITHDTTVSNFPNGNGFEHFL